MNALTRMFALAVAAGLAPPAVAAAPGCKLAKLVELPATMIDMRPTVSARINGADARFIVDSGAFFSSITEAAAAQYQLKTYPAPWGMQVVGMGGHATELSATTVKEFTLSGVPVHTIEFLVIGNEVGSDSAGVVGQNVLRMGDVEYDLANGVIRLWRENDCGKTNLAYWTAGSSQGYSLIDIDPTTPQAPHTTSVAYLNGTRIHVLFDTGASMSILSKRAASRAGFATEAAGVMEGGYVGGVGRARVRTWIAPFPSFKLGDEEVLHTKLRVGDTDLGFADMLIGADFFLSHRVFVASKQHKLFFTYNGGPVFNLTAAFRSQPPPPGATGPSGADRPEPSPPDGAAPPQAPADAADEPKTAAEYARRAAALSARGDFERALSDLDRACVLEPDQPDHFYERGGVHMRLHQPARALADFDRALDLDPDHVLAHLGRAELRVAAGRLSEAIEDLDAASRAAPREADARLRLASDFAAADLLPQAVMQLDAWMVAHPDDARMAFAMNSRCWARALLGRDLDQALKDCNASLKRIDVKAAGSANWLAGRGLVQLRLGDYAKSLKDFDAALGANPQHAWALYGRGIDEIRLGKAGEGRSDLAAAAALSPGIAESYSRHGITP